MFHNLEKGITGKKIVVALIIIVLGAVIIPQVVQAADCPDNPTYNYTKCLEENHNLTPEDHNLVLQKCACCVINSTGSLSSLCPSSSYDISHCSLPIGVAIAYVRGISVTGDESHPIVYTSPTICDNCCNVGILVNNLLEDKLSPSNIVIKDVVVNNWANGVMLWRVTNTNITASTMEENGNGIYLFNSQFNNISSNKILNNSKSGIFLDSNKELPQGPPKTSDNIIYNNYFKNAKNASYYSWKGALWSNTWNLSKTPLIPPKSNIVGGPNLGGNYWANLIGTGYCESNACNLSCNSDGFCNAFQLYPNNIDNLPLCSKPYFEISLSGDIDLGEISIDIPKEDSTVDMMIDTNYQYWTVTTKDAEGLDNEKPATGHMVEYNNGMYGLNSLTDPIQVRSKNQTDINWPDFQDLDNDPPPIIQTGICSGGIRCTTYYDIGVRQEVVFGDAKLSGTAIYRVNITFVGGTT